MKKTSLLVAFMMLFCIGIASAATFVSPSSGGLLSGTTAMINVSVTSIINVSNCTVTATSALTGDSISTTLYVNAGRNYTLANNSAFDTTSNIDAADWIFTGTCYNLTGGGEESITSVTAGIDNTEPVCTFGQNSSTTYKPSQTFSLTGTYATSATIKFGSNAALTMTETTADYFTYSGDLDQGVFDVTATTSDGTNTTDCTLTNVRLTYDNNLLSMAVATSGAAAGAKAADTQAKNNSNIILFGGAAAALIWFLMKKK